jgi:tRNA pseudouridine65 synthase
VIDVLHETESWVVVAKPSGIAVHRSAHVGDDVALLQLVRDQVGMHLHPVHRLDRPTSGCLVFAKSGAEHTRLAAALADPRSETRYWALLRGELMAPVDEQRALRKKGKGPTGEPQPARTVFTPLARWSEPRCTLVDARITTGRYHQIRRHAAGLSHPVLGDSTHGDTRANRVWRDEHGLPRLALHCHRLRLVLDDGVLDVHCPLPDDLRAVLEALPGWDEACLRPLCDGEAPAASR